MSKSRHAPSRRPTCYIVRFAEVDLPLRPRPVIQFNEGLSLLLADQVSVSFTAEFIDFFREPLIANGGRP